MPPKKTVKSVLGSSARVAAQSAVQKARKAAGKLAPKPAKTRSVLLPAKAKTTSTAAAAQKAQNNNKKAQSNKKTQSNKVAKAVPLRYAHPFFTSTPPGARPQTPYGQRMQDFAVQHLGPIPKPLRNPVMQLAEVIGQQSAGQLAAAGVIRFHAVGDTGRHGGSVEEEDVAKQMGADYKVGNPTTNPAFLFHMGDVIYGPGKDNAYRDAFYRPFMNYTGKIIAIPGNHDGETFPGSDPVSLEAFQANFCLPTSSVPPIAQGVGILRQMVAEPGVYWWLQHDLFDLIALYSNDGEGQGDLTDGKGDTQQTNFLQASLKSIAAARATSKITKALLLAAHHPAFSNGGHTGSAQMLAQMDAACAKARIVPHVVLAGHAHSYQRYTRRNTITASPATTTFLVAGTGGYGLQAVAAATQTAHPTANASAAVNPPVYDAALKAYGYLALTIDRKQVKVDFWQVPGSTAAPYDSVTCAL